MGCKISLDCGKNYSKEVDKELKKIKEVIIQINGDIDYLKRRGHCGFFELGCDEEDMLQFSSDDIYTNPQLIPSRPRSTVRENTPIRSTTDSINSSPIDLRRTLSGSKVHRTFSRERGLSEETERGQILVPPITSDIYVTPTNLPVDSRQEVKDESPTPILTRSPTCPTYSSFPQESSTQLVEPIGRASPYGGGTPFPSDSIIDSAGSGILP